MTDQAQFTVNYFQFCLQGKIKEMKVINGVVYTVITSPAPDLYSSPSQFEIRSNRKLGTIGEEIDGILCQITGFHQNKNYIDKETGEQKSYKNKVVNLIAVD